jgi:hypothetical protein
VLLSPAGCGEDCFLNFGLGEIADLLEVEMRKVGQFVGRNHAVDNGRAFGLERPADGLAQLAGLFGLEAYPAAVTRQRRKIRIGEVDGLFPGRRPKFASAYSVISPRAELL